MSFEEIVIKTDQPQSMGGARPCRVSSLKAPPSGSKAESWRDFIPAAALFLLGAIALTIATLLRPAGDGHYLVITAPWAGFEATLSVIAQAEGGLISLGSFDNIVIAGADDPDFADRALAAGAWLVLPAPLFFGCVSAAGARG